MSLRALRTVLIVFPFLSLAQPLLEQLKESLKTGSDTEKLPVLIQYAKEVAASNPDSALVIAKAALQRCELLNIDSLKGQAYIALSTSYSFLADYHRSTSNAFNAIKVAEEYKDTVSLIDAFNNLGIDFMLQEDYPKSIEYFDQVRLLSEQFGDSLRLGHALNNLGLTYGYMDEIERELSYYDQASTIFLDIGEKEGYANTLLNSGTAYTLLEQFSEANPLYEDALIVFQEIQMTSGVQNTLLSMAENHLGAGNIQEAEEKALAALEIAIQYQFAQDQLYTYDLLSQIAERKKDHLTALDYHKQARSLGEQLFTKEKTQQIAKLETEYQTEKKEQELAITSLQLSQQRTEKYLWIGAFSLVVGIGGLALYTFRQKSQLNQRLLHEEIENLKLKISSLLGDSDAIQLDRKTLNDNLHQPLSEREFEILNLTISDKTNKEIADTVYLSVNTVKFHLKNVYEKLGVSNRKEALQLIVTKS